MINSQIFFNHFSMKMFCAYRIGYVLTNKFKLHKKMQYFKLVLKRIDALESKKVLMLSNFEKFVYVMISSLLYDKDIIL